MATHEPDQRYQSKSPRKRRQRGASRLRKPVLIVAGIATAVTCVCLLSVAIAVVAGMVATRPGGGPMPDGAGADDIAAAPGFAVIQALDEAAQLPAEVAQRKADRALVRKLADGAPPPGPDDTVTTRSTLGHLVALDGQPDQWADAIDSRVQGEPGKKDEAAKYVDELLRRGGAGLSAAVENNSGLWQAIPIDRPATPFKLGLTTGIPLEPSPGGPFHPRGVMGGPYFIPYPAWLTWRLPGAKSPWPAHPIIDLRDGKTVGTFDWHAPVWANPRLSPDASFLVGTDTPSTLDLIMASTINPRASAKDVIYIWARGKDRESSFKVPGPVDWMEFVGNDRLAYVTYTPTTVLRMHDVATNQQIAEIELPGAKAVLRPDRQHDETPVYPGLDHYRPMARRGAVSANYKYVALGCPDGVRVVSLAEHKVIGLLPIKNAEYYRWVNFSADGSRLFAFVVAATPHGAMCFFRSWSVATGAPQEELVLDRFVTGPIYPGPVDGLYVADRFYFTRNPLPLAKLPLHLVRIDDDGTALVIGPRAQAPPTTTPPQSVLERIKYKQAPAEDANRKDSQYALFTTRIDWSAAVKQVEPVAALFAPRPAARAGDRTGVAAQKAEPPATWTPPPFGPAPTRPAEGDDPKARHQFSTWPVSFGDDGAVRVRFVPRVQHRKRWEVWLDVLDRTGTRALPPAKLWDWGLFPDQAGPLTEDTNQAGQMSPRPLPALAALRPDGSALALVDPNDPRRVDLFKPGGERTAGLLVHADRRIDWLGWSTTHLLTVSAGKLTAWDASAPRALFETAGGYTHVGALAPDRKWLVLWTGKHADILDTTTGTCLGRCQAGGFAGRLEHFTLAPDGKRLAALFTGWPRGMTAAGPGYTAVVWDLQTGKARLFGVAGTALPLGRGIPPLPTCTWAGTEHLLVSGQALTEPTTLLDVRLGLAVGRYKLQGGGYAAGPPALPARTSPDGRLWYPTTAIAGAPKGFNPNVGHDPDFPAGFVWRTVVLPGLHGQDAYLVDPGREWIDLSGLPVQVQVKLASRSDSEGFARSLARAVQAQGFTIGRGGTALRVEGTIEETNETLTLAFGGEAKVPQCVISAKWLSAQDTELWKTDSKVPWSKGGSRYKVSDTHSLFGPGGGVRTLKFDFKGRNPAAAMREELLEGLTSGTPTWLQLPELQFLRVQGRDHPLPVVGTLDVRMPP
jgi:hypothetical protein